MELDTPNGHSHPIVPVTPPPILPLDLPNGIHEEVMVSVEELERELPVVNDGQVPLGDLLSRVVQAIYAELSELAET